MKSLLLCLVCLVTLTTCMAQEFSDKSSFTVDVNKFERFHLYNRRGAVTVKATNGNQAKLNVTRKLKAKSNAKLNEAKKEIYLDSMVKEGQIIFFIQFPDHYLHFADDGNVWYRSKNEGWNWDKKEEDRVKAEFTITLEIPANEPLTVVNHEHPLKVSGMQADLVARNHHDGVLVENQGGSADVHSHHGNVELFYTKNPTRACTYDTHHGDIKVHFQNGLSADASLYSYHGAFFTAFDWTMKPAKVVAGKGKNAKYRISNKKGTSVQLGNGGPLQSFKTHHGDIYLMNSNSK